MSIRARSSSTTPPAAAPRIGTGIGKTEKALDCLATPEWTDKSVYYCVPEHALADEVAKRFTDMSVAKGGPPGMVFRGRQQEHPSGDPMCKKADLVALVTRSVGNVLRTLCERAAVGGRKAEYCEHHPERGGGCRYMQQALDGRPGVRFMPHNYLTLPKPEGIPKPDLVIIDGGPGQLSAALESLALAERLRALGASDAINCRRRSARSTSRR